MTTDPRDRLILALDVPSADEAQRLLDRVGDAVRFVKIGFELFTASGPVVVATALAHGKKVFLDLKLYDIGETVKRATAVAAELGVTLFTVHAVGQTVAAAVAGRGSSPMKIIAVTVLTSLTGEDLKETGVEGSVSTTVLQRARLAASRGADGVVASGVDAAMIREALGTPFVIVTPGIRPSGVSEGDQVHISTPRGAILAGSDYLVVGRPIRDAADPGTAARAIQAEIVAACGTRG
jgi:orotidine-5'-phosphate decarboxylase